MAASVLGFAASRANRSARSRASSTLSGSVAAVFIGAGSAGFAGAVWVGGFVTAWPPSFATVAFVLLTMLVLRLGLVLFVFGRVLLVPVV